MEVVKDDAQNVNDIEVVDAETVSPNQGTPKYDPSEQYVWGPDAVFTLTGQEFGLILNTIRGKVITKEAMEYRMLFDCNDILEGLMEKSVSNGTIIVAPKSTN